MSFLIIRGSFHLVGRTSKGTATGFQPDGDSMQFKPDNPALLDQLEQVSQPYRLTSIGSTQLRFEGIDALELHFEGHHQPLALADASRDYLTGQLGMNPVPYKPPQNVTVAPPAPHDGTRGFILAQALEVYGRPVAFVFEGDPPGNDGDAVSITAALLRKSLNFKSLATGNSYPLFYDTLLVGLRNPLTTAAKAARSGRKGLWKADRTTAGLTVTDEAALEEDGVIFPKIFRRLTSYFDEGNQGLDGFLPWLKATKEQVLDLTTGNFTHLDDMLAITNGKLELKVEPEQLVVISAKTTSTRTAPWLAY